MDTERLIALLKDYEDIRNSLEKELFKENQSVLYADLVGLITKISDYILRKEEIIRKGVGDVMGGKVLELESERLLRIGKAEGRAEGRAEGKAEGRAEEQMNAAREFVRGIDNLIVNLKLSLEEACAAIGSSVQKYEESKKMLNM